MISGLLSVALLPHVKKSDLCPFVQFVSNPFLSGPSFKTENGLQELTGIVAIGSTMRRNRVDSGTILEYRSAFLSLMFKIVSRHSRA